jgi:hypothetical protein
MDTPICFPFVFCRICIVLALDFTFSYILHSVSYNDRKTMEINQCKGCSTYCLITMISGIGFLVSLLHLTESMITSDNSSHFKAATFVSQYLHNNNNNNSNYKNKIILI